MMRIHEFVWPQDRIDHIDRHGVTPEDVEGLLERIDLIYPSRKVTVTRYGPLIGSLIGPGGMAVAVYEED